MINEIKFRVYDKDTYEMYYISAEKGVDYAVTVFLNGWELIEVTAAGASVICSQIKDHRDDGELMQYLGIKDKNDKEIYEGDIVATNYPSFPKGVVEYYYGEYVLRDGAMVMPIAKLRRFDWRLEVVGHIYDKSKSEEGGDK